MSLKERRRLPRQAALDRLNVRRAVELEEAGLEYSEPCNEFSGGPELNKQAHTEEDPKSPSLLANDDRSKLRHRPTLLPSRSPHT